MDVSDRTRPASALYSRCKNVPRRAGTLHERENAVNTGYICARPLGAARTTSGYSLPRRDQMMTRLYTHDCVPSIRGSETVAQLHESKQLSALSAFPSCPSFDGLRRESARISLLCYYSAIMLRRYKSAVAIKGTTPTRETLGKGGEGFPGSVLPAHGCWR